jgi:single-strand selective monofunctional uracil DNA glycosylase
MNLMRVTDRLNAEIADLQFAPPVTCVYNPLDYARAGWDAYVKAYGQGKREILLVGMNPGPFGMAQTGVPFGDVCSVRDWMDIEATILKPRVEHPRRPVEGFACRRREVSGQRLWGWAAERFGSAKHFFSRFFITNYCPLCFLEVSGRNRTPDKLRVEERSLLFAPCDRALRAQIACLQPQYVLGIGVFAESRVRAVVDDNRIRTGRILHPSPASPAANRGWSQAVEQTLREMGIAF